jgi:hypothetical protein
LNGSSRCVNPAPAAIGAAALSTATSAARREHVSARAAGDYNYAGDRRCLTQCLQKALTRSGIHDRGARIKQKASEADTVA